MLTDLENELEALKLERRSLEAHQQQVESWWKHVGQWNATVVQHEVGITSKSYESCLYLINSVRCDVMVIADGFYIE